MSSTSQRQSRASPPRSPPLRRTLTSTDVEQGNILWLAPKTETLASLRKRDQQRSEPVLNCTHPEIVPEDGFYNHRILVLSRPAVEPHTIRFLLTTTFKGKPLTKRFKRGRRKNIPREWFEYLAIAPASDHPLLEDLPRLYRTLDFENCTATDAPAYVKVSEVYSMDWRDAQLLWRGNAAQQQPARLDAASLATLLYAVNVGGRYIVEEQYDPTAVLPQLARQPTATSSTLAAGKRIATSSPAEGDPLSLVIPPVGSPIPDRPVAAKTTSTVRTHPPVGRSHPGRTLVNEQQPLLPSYHRNQAPGDSSPEKGFFGWLWAYLKKTRLAIIIRAVCFCDWS